MSEIFTNSELKKLIREAKAKQKEKAEIERKKKEFQDAHFGVTESEYQEIQERIQKEVDEEQALAEEKERLRIEELNKPRKVQIEYKITFENKNESKPQEPEENPILEWCKNKKAKEGEKQ